MTSNITLKRLTLGRAGKQVNGVSLITSGSLYLEPTPINPNELENGSCSISGGSTQGSSNLSLITSGIQPVLTGLSHITSGFQSSITTSEDVECLEGVIQTSHAPLTKGWGNAELATPNDVKVWVDGKPREVVNVIAIKGLIYLKSPVKSGSEVKVEYFYTKNPTLFFKEIQQGVEVLDNEEQKAYTFNTWNSSETPHPYSIVYGPETNLDQPLLRGYRYTALEHVYSATLNDPNNLLYNEPPFMRLAPMSRDLTSKQVFFEGNSNPSNGWKTHGTPPAVPEFEDDLFVIEDSSVSADLVNSDPLFYSYPMDLSYPHVSNVVSRLRLDTYTKVGEFTGTGFGYSTSSRLVLAGLLDIGGFKTIGILSNRGDETHWQSYNGLKAIVAPRDVNGVLRNDRLLIHSNLTLSYGDRISVGGSVYEVGTFQQGSTSTVFEIILTTEMSVQGEVQIFLEVDHSEITTYRINKNDLGSVQVTVNGSVAPSASIVDSELPAPNEIFELLEINSLFFGSVSRQAANRSCWDYARYNIIPLYPEETSNGVSVHQTYEHLPETDLQHPWTVIDNQGYSTILPGNYLLMEQAGRISNSSNTYARIEPLLTSRSQVSLTTRLKVNSFSEGIPAFVSVVDNEKELTLGFFGEPSSLPPRNITDAASFIATKGNYPEQVPNATSGLIVPQRFSSANNVEHFRLSYSGTKSFQDEGWTVSGHFVSKHTDRYHTISKDSNEKAEAYVVLPNPNQHSHLSYSFAARLRFKESFTDAQGLASPILSIKDSYQDLRIGFYDDGFGNEKVVFVDSHGQILVDHAFNPIGADFTWNDGKFHTYKVRRNFSAILLYIDGVVKASPSTSDLGIPSSGPDPNELDFSLEFTSPKVTIDVDYLYTHSNTVITPKVGVFMGGDINDPNAYESITANWLGSFLDLKITRDPTGRVLLYLNGSATPDLRVEYNSLPARTDRTGMNTLLGYIRHGILDSKSFSETVWEHIKYHIYDTRENQRALPFSYYNNGHVITSPEPVEDDAPEDRVVLLDTENRIYLSSKGIYAKQILSVTNLDDTYFYPFQYESDLNEIVLLEDLIPRKSNVKIKYLSRHPYGWDYLTANGPVRLLNDKTPPLPLTYQNVWFETDPVTNKVLLIAEDKSDLDNFDLFEDLDLRIENLYGIENQLSIGCDEGMSEMILGIDPQDVVNYPFQDLYVFPQTINKIGDFYNLFYLDHSFLGGPDVMGISSLENWEAQITLENYLEEDVQRPEEVSVEISWQEYSGFILGISLLSEQDLLSHYDLVGSGTYTLI